MNVLGVGTDITECLRIAQMIERHGELFVDRVYTPLEIEYCRSRRMATQHFAGRWAAKEAVLKAIGTGWRRGISWRDIEVRNGPGGRPQAFLKGGTQEIAEKMGVSYHTVDTHVRNIYGKLQVHNLSGAVAKAIQLGLT